MFGFSFSDCVVLCVFVIVRSCAFTFVCTHGVAFVVFMCSLLLLHLSLFLFPVLSLFL